MLALIHSYFHNNLLGVPFLALATAIVCKGVFYALRGKWSFRRMLNSGNMPSSHAAFVTALTTAMWLKHGLYSDLFLICLVFTFITIYDAINVRYQAGLHARVLNRLTPEDGEELDESIGHTPFEALVGGGVGFLVAIALMGVNF